MSTQNKKSEKVTIQTLKNKRLNDEKIIATTAYDYTMARIADESDIDLILVGDSLGMVVQGEDTTLPVDIEHMIYHTKCVAKGVNRAHVMADMPFLSYQVSHEDAVKNAGLLLKAGAQSVKLEGGDELTDLIWYMNRVGIPVMAHIGLKPQNVNTMGGYKIQGKSKTGSQNLIDEALVLEEAGAFSLLLEGIPSEVAKEITEKVNIPTIGIGSGLDVTGQILVSYDLLGANPNFKPKFVRQYMNLFEDAKNAFDAYAKDIKSSSFPSDKESFRRNLVEVKNFVKS